MESRLLAMQQEAHDEHVMLFRQNKQKETESGLEEEERQDRLELQWDLIRLISNTAEYSVIVQLCSRFNWTAATPDSCSNPSSNFPSSSAS